MEWPSEADETLANLALIEKFLRKQIVDAHVTLLGEIDLEIATEYANLGWSMADLANFAFDKFRGRQSISSSLSVLYPSIIAVWTVHRAQNLRDGTELWANSGFKGTNKSKIAAAFSEAIDELGLENFERQLLFIPVQRHVNLARMHAIIPTYALTTYAAYIRGGVYYHRQPARVMETIVQAQDVASPVRRLFEFQPHLGVDLIDRSMKTMRLGNRWGLPPRIASALSGNPLENDASVGIGYDVPSVFFDPSVGELYINGHAGWALTCNPVGDVNPDDLPCATIIASRESDTGNVILDPFKEFLMFDRDKKLIEQRSIPSSGAFLLWKNSAKFDTSILAMDEPQRMGKKWKDWSWGWLRNDDGIEICLSNGNTIFIGTAPEIEIVATAVPHVTWGPLKHKVYGISPYFKPGQHASIMHNGSGSTPRKLNASGEDLISGDEQLFDFTVFAGLGRSVSETGLFLPGFDLLGNHNPMQIHEVRKFGIKVPDGWLPAREFEISGTEAQSGKEIQIHKSADYLVRLMFKPPVINWSVEFDDMDLQVLNETGIFRYEMLKQIQKIVIHGFSSSDPTLFAIDGDAKPQPFKGVSRDKDTVFDLRALRASTRGQKLDLNLSVNGERTTLVAFYPKEQPVRLSSLKELLSAVQEKGWFSDQEWMEIEHQRRQQNYNNRKFNRRGSLK